jgi:hypothetical protein
MGLEAVTLKGATVRCSLPGTCQKLRCTQPRVAPRLISTAVSHLRGCVVSGGLARWDGPPRIDGMQGVRGASPLGSMTAAAIILPGRETRLSSARCGAAGEVAAHLRISSAVLHAAPTAAAVLALVDEQPLAAIASLDPL